MSNPIISSGLISELLVGLRQHYGERPALGKDGLILSYADLEHLSRRLAAWFQVEMGLSQGDRLIVQLPNHPNYPLVLFAALRAGLVVVNLPNNCSLEDIEQALKTTRARVFVYDRGCAQAHIFLQHSGASLSYIQADADDMELWWRKGVVKSVSQLLSRIFKPSDGQGPYHLDRILSSDVRPGYRDPELDSSHPALIQYTSGTTGPAKCALVTHNSLLANLTQLNLALDEMEHQEPQRLLQALPLYHGYSLMITLAHWSRGGYVELVSDARNTNQLVDLFERVKPTSFVAISPIFIELSRHLVFSQLDFSQLVCTFSGTAPVSEPLAERWALITGCTITQAYGIAEASPFITLDTSGPTRSGCLGKPLIETQIRIVDEQGLVLPTGGVGDIQVKGPQTVPGYWSESGLSSLELSPDGWFRTGDIGRLSPEGKLGFVERKSDVIQLGGFRVFPSDVEMIVNAHPDVIDCSVVAVDDQKGLKQLKLVVVSNNRHLTRKQIRDYCRERLTQYKVPSIVEFRETLPHSPVGRVLRHQLQNPSSYD